MIRLSRLCRGSARKTRCGQMLHVRLDPLKVLQLCQAQSLLLPERAPAACVAVVFAETPDTLRGSPPAVATRGQTPAGWRNSRRWKHRPASVPRCYRSGYRSRADVRSADTAAPPSGNSTRPPSVDPPHPRLRLRAECTKLSGMHVAAKLIGAEASRHRRMPLGRLAAVDALAVDVLKLGALQPLRPVRILAHLPCGQHELQQFENGNDLLLSPLLRRLAGGEDLAATVLRRLAPLAVVDGQNGHETILHRTYSQSDLF